MYRTNNCGELKISDVGKTVTLAGWVQKIRNKGFLIWIDLRDRYGITQLIINSEKSSKKVIQIYKICIRKINVLFCLQSFHSIFIHTHKSIE